MIGAFKCTLEDQTFHIDMLPVTAISSFTMDMNNKHQNMQFYILCDTEQGSYIKILSEAREAHSFLANNF